MKDRRISAYFATRNQSGQSLDLADVVTSYLGFAFEVVICDAGSDDGTWEELMHLAAREPRVRLLRYARVDTAEERRVRSALALAREACRGAYVFEGSPTLLVQEEDSGAFDGLIDRLTPEFPVLALPVLRFRGGLEHVRRDVALSRPCLSRNDPTIGYDAERGTYVDRVRGDRVPCLETIPASLDLMRQDGSPGQALVQALDEATRELPVLWCHAEVRDVLPAHRVPADLVPTPTRRDRVLRPQPRSMPVQV